MLWRPARAAARSRLAVKALLEGWVSEGVSARLLGGGAGRRMRDGARREDTVAQT
jgi:hypothetical protein